MRRLGPSDRLLLATLIPIWACFLWISVGEGLRNGQLRIPLAAPVDVWFLLEPAADA